MDPYPAVTAGNKEDKSARGDTSMNTLDDQANPQSLALPARSLFKDVVFGLVVCILLLLGAEIVLRLIGWPGKDGATDPYVGFAAMKPLFVENSGMLETASYKLEYFNDESFPAKKARDTIRIFCFGGSTTHGRPYDSSSAFTRWLEDLLSESVPERNFEVINAGGISYASYRIVPLVREVLNYEPDLVVIYTGHNEFLERRTYSGLFLQGKTFITLRSLAERLAIYRGLQEVLLGVLPLPESRSSLQPSSNQENGSANTLQAPEDAGRPKRTILSEEVSATLDWSGGLDLYHRDEEFAKGVLIHFEQNLQKMVDICKRANLPVILIEPAANLKDFSPFKSESTKDLTVSELRAVEKNVKAVSRLVADGRNRDALKIVEALENEAPLYAETYYWKGKALLALGERHEARAAFVRAKDLDVCPLRSITQIQRIVAEVASRNNVTFIPFRKILWERMSATGDNSGVPGNESFLDHVHPTIEVHQLLAKLIMNEMVRMKAVNVSESLSEERMTSMFKEAVASLDTKFMALGDLNLAKVLSWSGKVGEARVALERAAKVLDTDPEVYEMLGNSYLDYDEPEKAIQAYKKAVELSNAEPDMLFALANAYDESGAEDLAIKIYRELIAKAPLGPEVDANLAQIYLEQGRTTDAEKVIKSGLQRFPDSEMLVGEYGVLLAVSGKYEEAIPWLKRALDKQPGNGKILYDLAAVHALSGNHKEALECLESAVQKRRIEPDLLQHAKVFESVRHLPRFQNILNRLQ